MRRLPALYLRMLRYRVAAMVWLFMLLAASYRDGLELTWDYPLAAVALASSYVTATALNDVADVEIDRVNHPRDRGRPLVNGEVSERDLLRLRVVAAGLALGCAAAVGTAACAAVALSLAIAYSYSLPPFRFSYRTYLAPLVLAVAYVGVPYVLGVQIAKEEPEPLFAAALFALFVARISLKDFRDRAGDARYGRPTLLLRVGKTATCVVSLVFLVTGNVLLVMALRPPAPLALLIEVFVAGIAWMLYVLWRAEEGRAEQVAIGLGARIGNGLLLTLLAWLVLAGEGAGESDRLVFATALTALFVVSSAALAARPERVVIGYKG